MQKTTLCGRSARGGIHYITKTLLVMKLTFFLLTAGFLNAYAAGLSQTVSFSGHDVSIQEVLSVVKQQTGFLVFYDNDILKDSKPISLAVKDEPLLSFLSLVLKGQSL